MIVLDTNVLSEPFRPEPSERVLAWLDEQDPQALFVSAITLAEFLAGIHLLPKGRKRADLQRIYDTQVLPLFEGRVLNFDREAALAFAKIHAKTRAAGQPMDFADAAIAATASSRSMAVATRNLKDFEGAGVELLNPWRLHG